MQNQVKKYFRLTHVECYNYEDETITTIACRHCSLAEIIQEVEDLNKNYEDYQPEESYRANWKYYDYEELFFSEKGNFNSDIFIKSMDYEINKKGLINLLTSDSDGFDQRFKYHKKKNDHYIQYGQEFDLKESVMSDYGGFIIGDFTKEDIIKTIKELSEAGQIKTDLTFLGL